MAVWLTPMQGLQSQNPSAGREAAGRFAESARLGVTYVPQSSSPADGVAQWSSSEHVIAGALAGVALYSLGLAIYFNQSSEEFLGHPAALLLPAVGAAALGALVGWTVYKLGGSE